MLHFFYYVADKCHIDLNFKVTIQIIDSFDHESFYVFLSFFYLFQSPIHTSAQVVYILLHLVKEHMYLYFRALFTWDLMSLSEQDPMWVNQVCQAVPLYLKF